MFEIIYCKLILCEIPEKTPYSDIYKPYRDLLVNSEWFTLVK